MKTIKITIKIILSTIIIFSTLTVANNKLEHDFYVYNTIIEYEAYSEYGVVFNRETKKVKYQNNYDKRAYPASLTKIMTAVVAIENTEDMSKPATIDAETFNEMLRRNSAMAGFSINEKVTMLDLLYGMMLSSGGEATSSLAVNIAGSRENFIKLMNEKAKDLGLVNTHFVSVVGLHDPDHYSTAEDLTILLDYALDNELFKEVFTSLNYQTISTPQHPDGIILESTVLSELLDFTGSDYEIIGGKSGTTIEAGKNWATLSKRNNVEYIAIFMGAYDYWNPSFDEEHIKDTISVLELLNESDD